MKKLLLGLGIAGLLLSLAYAADVTVFQDSKTNTGTYYTQPIEVADYQNHVYARFRVTGTPTTTGSEDSIFVTLQTRYANTMLNGAFVNTASGWEDLFEMSAGVEDTATVDKWFLADSLAGVYSLGEFLRYEIILTDTITADTTWTDNPWTWTAYIGFQ